MQHNQWSDKIGAGDKRVRDVGQRYITASPAEASAQVDSNTTSSNPSKIARQAAVDRASRSAQAAMSRHHKPAPPPVKPSLLGRLRGKKSDDWSYDQSAEEMYRDAMDAWREYSKKAD